LNSEYRAANRTVYLTRLLFFEFSPPVLGLVSDQKKPERTSKYSPGLELRFEVGDGDSNIEIETLNGSVNICVDD
jgi:hypothetical protein